jgi:hypothetical protein
MISRPAAMGVKHQLSRARTMRDLDPMSNHKTAMTMVADRIPKPAIAIQTLALGLSKFTGMAVVGVLVLTGNCSLVRSHMCLSGKKLPDPPFFPHRASTGQ